MTLDVNCLIKGYHPDEGARQVRLSSHPDWPEQYQRVVLGLETPASALDRALAAAKDAATTLRWRGGRVWIEDSHAPATLPRISRRTGRRIL